MSVLSARWRATARFGCMAVACSVALLAVSAAAQASPITLGSTLTGSFHTSSCGSPCSLLNRKVAGSNPVASPVSGVVTRWRITGGSSGIPGYTLRILRPTGTTYTAIASSAPVTPVGPGLEIFNTSIPIQAGDLIGIDTPASGSLPIANDPAAEYVGWEPPLKDGESQPFIGPITGGELGYNADVLPPPTISSVSPASGPLQGGTGVVIAGDNFTEVKSVSFGSTLVQSFGVNTEGKQITAIAPPATSPGPVELSVTSIAGKSASTSTATFTYTAQPPPIYCVVPNLKSKTLKAVRKKLKAAHCTLGKVKGKKTKSAKVKKQSPKPGKVLASSAKVNVKLGG
jgi:hypothetical protein